MRAITAGLYLTEEKLRALISGDSTATAQKNVPQPTFPPDQIPTYSEKVLHVSAIMPWNGERYVIPVILEHNQHQGTLEPQDTIEKQSDRIVVSKLPLGDMFRLAFIGKWQWMKSDSLYQKYYPFPIFETTRNHIFEYSYKEGTGFYNYYLQTPAPATPRRIMELMQRELQTTFGFEARIEKRLVPVWKLVAKPGASQKLKTKGNPPGYTRNNNGDVAGFEFSNFPMSELLHKITRYISDNEPPFFDYTGIKHNIDIKMDVLLTDREQIVAGLRQNGLDLIKGDREMYTLVIRDARK